ncbi:MAG: hypothetical protein IKI57_04255 [Clostridia bacterium]|nr:hypothetical protein [Clostridia bacterium]
MDKTKTIFKYIITFFILIMIYNLSMYLVALIPPSSIELNCESSANIMLRQGYFIDTGFLSQSENGTDGLIINEAFSMDNENPLESYMLMRKNYKKGATKVVLPDKIGQLYTYSENKFDENGNPVPDEEYSIAKELKETINGKVWTSQTYTRYYHGYMLFYRPLLLVFNITQIRWFMTAILVMLFVAFELLLSKKLGLKYAAIFFGVFLSFGYFGLGHSLENAPLFVVLMTSLIVLLSKIDKYDDKKLRYFLFIVGSITNFFDFLTAPVITLAMTLLIYYAYNKEKVKEEKFINAFIKVFIFGLMWLLGYAFTWLSKALLVDLLFNGGGFGSLISQSLFRMGGEITEFEFRFQFLSAFCLKVLLICIVITCIALALTNQFKFKKNFLKEIIKNKYYLLASIICIAWLIILFNHTMYHFDLFPYRNLMVPMLALFMAIIDDKQAMIETKKEKKSKKNINAKANDTNTSSVVTKQSVSDKNDETTGTRVIKYILVYLVCFAIANILLMLVCMIPRDAVEKHVYESAELLLEEGPHPLINEMFETYNNNFTEAVIINEIYSVDTKRPINSYLTARKNYKEGQTERIIEENVGEGITAQFNSADGLEIVNDDYDSLNELSGFLDGNITTSLNYGRYWHGYLVLYRPLLVIFNLKQIKVFQLVLFIALFIVAAALIYKKYGLITSLLFSASLGFMGYFTAAYSIESAPTHIIMMVATIVWLIKKDKIKDIYLFFFVTGIFTNYVDYLTVPLLTIFMPLLLMMIDYSKEHTLKENIIFLIKSCIAWGVGYAGMWITKWAIYDLLIPGKTSMLKIGFSQSIYRMNRDNAYYGYDVSILEVIIPKFVRALRVILLNVILVIVLPIMFKKKKHNNKLDLQDIKCEKKFSFFIFFIIGLAPLAWYILLANHTFLHFFFTYRMIAIFILAMSVFLCLFHNVTKKQ